MANPVDAAANAAGQTVNAGRGLLGSAWSATKLVTKGLMVQGDLSVFLRSLVRSQVVVDWQRWLRMLTSPLQGLQTL